MPYSGDRTIVSATDDVRIFDIEHSGHSALGSGTRSNAERRRKGMAPDGVTLTEGDTSAKAFRSHNDTVKRIVTEDNPFYFLTCSNDGDVRQWDIRQPSKTYPPVRDTMLPQWARDRGASDSVPPPLISYSRYGLDLNSVSCSPSQPHYIALGGAHLHCFLHDRRMLGRDRANERGSRLSSPQAWSEHDNELLGKATQCVKKFAPNGKQRMKRHDGGHITACKISDAYPNELIVSWSQDHIYSFDMLRAPDAREEVTPVKDASGGSGIRVKDQSRKRKRPKSGVSSQETAERTSPRQRTESPNEDLALRVTYGNGQSEDIRIEPPAEMRMSQEELDELRATAHYRIAKTSVTIAKRIFNLAEEGETGRKLAFTSILGLVYSVLPDIDDIARTWGYPVDPDPIDVALQNKLRDSRWASRRFIQAAGTLARVLDGQLLIGSNSDAVISKHFATIQPAPREKELPRHEQFGYDFLKAILLWLDSGPSAVVEGFSSRSSSARLPIPKESDMDAIDDYLIPYLLRLASDDPIVNVDVSRFYADDIRVLYRSEKDAVIAFSHAIRIPFADLTGAVVPTSGDKSVHFEAQDRSAAKERWAFQVGRGVLRNASIDIKFAFVDRAFGGRGISENKIRAEEQALRERLEDIDPANDEGPVAQAELVRQVPVDTDQRRPVLSLSPGLTTPAKADRLNTATVGEDEQEDKEDGDSDSNTDSDNDEDEDAEDEEDEDEDEDEYFDDEEDEDEEEGEGLRRTRSGRMLWRSDFGRSRHLRERVERKVPCVPHTRVYTGHCNVKTVKDVNFFGLQDEYVVSGSDSGHVFIWDRKSTQLVDILEGDGEVVNVVQGMLVPVSFSTGQTNNLLGHPYEPTMAVSGIDHSIKIFSPDTRLQRNARKGIGVQCSDPNSFSSLNWGRRRQVPAPVPEHEPTGEALSDSDEEVAENGLRSRKRMHLSYQIMSKNDMDRRGGREDYFISQAVFAQLARHIAAQQGGGGGGETGEDGVPLVITEENCLMM